MGKTGWIVLLVIVLLLSVIGYLYYKNKPLLDKAAGTHTSATRNTAANGAAGNNSSSPGAGTRASAG